MEHINDFGVIGGLELLCWVVGTILFPNNHMTHKSYWIQMELIAYLVVSCIIILGIVS